MNRLDGISATVVDGVIAVLFVKTVAVGEKVIVFIVGVNKMSLLRIEDSCLVTEDVNKTEVSDWPNFIVLITVYIDVSKGMFPWVLTPTNAVVGDERPRSANDESPLPSVDKSPLPSVVFVVSPTPVG